VDEETLQEPTLDQGIVEEEIFQEYATD